MKWHYQHTVLSITLGAFFSTLFLKFSISTVVPQVTRELGSSKSEIGLALTGMWMATALVQYPSGVFGDRFGERRIILLSLILTALGGILVAVAMEYIAFFLFAVLVGVGTGLYIPAATSLLSKQFTDRGQALSLHIAGGNLAGLVGPVAAAYVTVRYGWRVAPALCILLILPLLAVLMRWMRSTPAVRPETPILNLLSPRRGLAILRRPSLIYSAFIGIIGIFAFQAIASFYPTFLVEYHQFSIQRAGTLFGVVFALSALSLPVMGKVADRFSPDTALIMSFLILMSGVILSLLPASWPHLFAVILVGLGISWGGALQARYLTGLHDDEVGTGFGVIRTVTGLIGSVGSVTVGTLAEHDGWGLAYGSVGALLAIAIVALFINRTLALDL